MAVETPAMAPHFIFYPHYFSRRYSEESSTYVLLKLPNLDFGCGKCWGQTPTERLVNLQRGMELSDVQHLPEVLAGKTPESSSPTCSLITFLLSLFLLCLTSFLDHLKGKMLVFC